MRKIAFLFAGQGAQYVGMGKDLYENIPSCRDVFEEADKVLGFKISEICFNGPVEDLNNTENTQPAIVTVNMAVLKALEENGIKAEVSAGLSLGEYSALIYGGAMKFEEVVPLVKKRGRFMQEAVPVGIGGMAAIIKLKDEEVIEICKEASTVGLVQGANFNCPGQVVVAGVNAAVDKAVELAIEKGGRGKKLPVSAPFHCSLLEPAAVKLEQELKNIDIKTLSKPTYSNVTGDTYKEDSNILASLRDQVMSSVLFSNIISNMIAVGVDTFIEVGPGKTLSGFVKKISKDVDILNIENMDTLNKAIAFIKES
ncbi:ACP S-malonyltransferase [Clostridium cellulovorans]|uniref:Malonyl CoA-acyl carrier protein transacylase n=1 Tax=Clostridium cellulovorans (strain ATCC 35296 / DSM 3052 / OCM 3 / 743B) TaxID=573061 RepID=D9SME6_CLOC7|nr:ACP S-malonyltransferase [Clostridium cellulovorans]ADL53802.1 malonyl CoA-acyl carrier protein transacylase [Clostridium cellulovorans 743B]